MIQAQSRPSRRRLASLRGQRFRQFWAAFVTPERQLGLDRPGPGSFVRLGHGRYSVGQGEEDRARPDLGDGAISRNALCDLPTIWKTATHGSGLESGERLFPALEAANFALFDRPKLEPALPAWALLRRPRMRCAAQAGATARSSCCAVAGCAP